MAAVNITNWSFSVEIDDVPCQVEADCWLLSSARFARDLYPLFLSSSALYLVFLDAHDNSAKSDTNAMFGNRLNAVVEWSNWYVY